MKSLWGKLGNSLVIGFLILTYVEVWGADWKLLQTNFQGEFFYDSENITHSSENIVGVSLKIIYSGKFKEQENLNKLDQTIGLWEINCEEKKICLVSTSHYSREGEISSPQVWLPPEWKSIAPNTIMDALYKALCK